MPHTTVGVTCRYRIIHQNSELTWICSTLIYIMISESIAPTLQSYVLRVWFHCQTQYNVLTCGSVGVKRSQFTKGLMKVTVKVQVVSMVTYLISIHFNEQILCCIEGWMGPGWRLKPVAVKVKPHEGTPKEKNKDILTSFIPAHPILWVSHSCTYIITHHYQTEWIINESYQQSIVCCYRVIYL